MPRPEDIHIGQRIRQRRKVLGLTQQQVAASIGVKFQQLQKYETAANRVSGSRLTDLAKVLQVTPSYFFEGIDTPVPNWEIRTSEELAMIVNFRQAPDATRDAILSIAQAAARAGAHQPTEKEKANG